MKSNFRNALKKWIALAELSNKHKIPIEDVFQENQAAVQSRREFLRQYGSLNILAGAALSPLLTGASDIRKKSNSRIGIVGAGLAGLTAAFYLKERGIEATIFEASKRPGGRIVSKKRFGDGQLVTEVGAEFIDTGHRDLLFLIRRLGLDPSLLDMTSDNFGEKEIAFIEGRHYHQYDIIRELSDFFPQIAKIKKRIKKDDYLVYDRMSLAEYLDSIPISRWLKKLIEAGFVGENGAEAGEQSAAIMLSTLEMDKDEFRMYGSSDERFKLKGGNESLPKKLSEIIGERIFYEHRLFSVKEKVDGSVVLAFSQDGTTKEYVFDAVVLAIPFTILREVELGFEMPKIKRKVINELGYGINTKFIIETNGRPWRDSGCQGYLFNDEISNGWDSSQLQTSTSGKATYTCYLGGNRAKDASPENESLLWNRYKPHLNGAFEGMISAFSGNSELAFWKGNPYVKASYSYLKPGQFLDFGDWAFEPVRNIYFAGEHTSTNWWGFMNGAAESGRRVAGMILKNK